MSELAIRVEGLGKRFRIGQRRRQSRTLRDTIAGAFAAPFRRAHGPPSEGFRRNADDTFWALRDISFTVNRGQVVGILGRNGSGKSTLLKILSRITPPTEGEATIVGRVGSLLEIGTGFHHELTGRENIFLSGTILGMKRQEITQRFDEIVSFSGVEKFIDAPVKHYSSGMYLRLAFAVAAHLRTEILLIDEVLAVGDAGFQKKCIEKMSEVARGGRTVLFVSHNMAAVSRLCDLGIVLDSGRVISHGDAASAVKVYERLSANVNEQTLLQPGCGVAIHGLQLDCSVGELDPSSRLPFLYELVVSKPYWELVMVFGLRTVGGEGLVLDAFDSRQLPELLRPGRYAVRVVLPPLWLRPRIYTAQAKVVAHPETGPTERFVSDCLDVPIGGEGSSGLTDRLLLPHIDWRVEPRGTCETPSTG